MSVSPHDLRLHITRPAQPGAYLVTLTEYHSDTPPTEATVEGFQSRHFQSEYLDALRTYAEREFPHARLQAMGQEIARLLLPESVRQRILTRLWHYPTVPVRLFVTTDRRELAIVPWEYAFVEADGQALKQSGFLCRHPFFHLIRQSSVPRSVQPSTEQKLRVLIAWADPAAGDYARLPHLHDEIRSIEAALNTAERRHIEIKTLDGVTHARLKRGLEDFCPHILHFLGHGDALPSGGVLILEGGQSKSAERLYAEELAAWLKPTPCELVVLSACHTASPERGMAASLSEEGVPAVVGMHMPMRSATSGAFARGFYSALVQARGVEEALSQTRQELDEFRPDWGVPVLYMTDATGVLFPCAPSDLSHAPRPPEGVFHVTYKQNLNFLGREAKMEELHQSLKEESGPPIALAGMGGLGKTQMAVEYAHRSQKEYPGGIYWIHAHTMARLSDEYADLSREFDVPETLSTRERIRRLCDHFNEIKGRSLLIFDNITEETYQSLLPVKGRCRVLVTTRLRYLVDSSSNFRQLDLPLLDTKDAIDLLWKMSREMSRETSGAGGEEDSQKPTDPQDEKDMQRIAELLGCLPLALALAANHVRRLGKRFGEYLTILQAEPVRTLGKARLRFITATQHDGSLFDTLAISHDALSPDAQKALSLLGCFAGRGISPDLLYQAFVAGSDHDLRLDFDEALAELRDLYFMEREADQRISVHELTRIFALGQMPEKQRRNTIEQITGALTKYLNEANERMDWYAARREIAHCRMAEDLCQKHGADQNYGDLLQAMGVYSEAHGEYDTAIRYLNRSVERMEQRPGEPSVEMACLLRQLGDVFYNRGEKEDSSLALDYHRDALTIAESLLPENDARLIAYYSSLGVVLKREQEFEEAAKYLNKALTLCKQVYLPPHAEFAISLNNVGTLLEAQDKIEEALLYLEEALAIDRDIFGAQHPNIAIRLNNIGRILSKQGKYADALTRHREALEIIEQAFGRRHPDFAASLFYCGNALASQGQKEEEVRALYTEALDIYTHFSGADHFRCDAVRQRLQSLEE